MDGRHTASTMNRRAFLTMFAGAAALSAAAPAGWTGARGGRSLRVGLLAPASTAYVQPLRSFQLGLSAVAATAAGSQQAQRRLRLLKAEYGLSNAQLLRQSVRWLERRSVDLVIGLVSPGQAGLLRDLYAEHRTPLIAVNIGADVPRPNERNPYVFYRTLQEWQANYGLGVWSAQHLGPRALIVAAGYDSGYDSLDTFRRGYAHGGGVAAQTVVTGAPLHDDHIAAALQAIEAQRPDVVYARYTGELAIEFVRAYAAAGWAKRIPLVGSAFLTDEAILPRQGRAALGIRTAALWNPISPLAEPLRVAARRQGMQADAFVALGYETGRLLDGALAAAAGRRSRAALRDGLEAVTTNRAAPTAPSAVDGLHLRQVRFVNGRLANAPMTTDLDLSTVDELPAALQQTRSGSAGIYMSA